MQLDEKDLKLLIAIQEDPMIRYSELAKKFGFSPTTISNRYNEISKKTLNRVIAEVDLNSLELEMVELLIELETLKNSLKVEKFCDDHLYTLYRSRVFGKFTGLFVQFRIPRGTKEKLLDQFEKLKKTRIVINFTVLESFYPKIFTKVQLDYWIGNMKWNFNWFEWQEQLNQILELKAIPTPDLNNNI